ncbi:BgTH12-06138 [Blumeria graminis f. sp. triticale]|uniref:BgtAcSP-31023 n=3 Tax=Blumeria graminis TaxID=34373 RepID=A0A9X9MKY2_BLUGR|nr:hypothetical protein BGT96224_AcSP31023 [Blumeria graminis f. sp. tritici 96224]CAD6504408.1 BgTH12-06138 [Blumeria graminis f. sp. triticale]VDB91255.1 BgtAcSP-31023 [Blumeria graminis f. sp. tritici]
MRFSSIAIILQSASIFFTTEAGATVNHINERKKSFICDEVTFKFNQFPHQRGLTEDAAGMTAYGSLYQIYMDKLEVHENEHTNGIPFRYADRHTTNLSFYLLANLTSYQNLGTYDLRFDYYVVVDGRNRATAMLLKTTPHNRSGNYEQSTEPYYTLCKVGALR